MAPPSSSLSTLASSRASGRVASATRRETASSRRRRARFSASLGWNRLVGEAEGSVPLLCLTSGVDLTRSVSVGASGVGGGWSNDMVWIPFVWGLDGPSSSESSKGLGCAMVHHLRIA
jgi:hypothetical protein